MNVSTADLVGCVADLECASPAELSTIVESLPADKREDSQELAKALVQANKVTKFQATLLLKGQGKSLLMGDYVVLDRIGAGGMGQVFRARHRRMDRIVALKVISSKALAKPDVVQRFQREVKAAARLIHPNIVTAFDAGEQNGAPYLVMELVEGPDLATVLKKQGLLPVGKTLELIQQAARGLAFAHSKGVVHRDVKPGNLLVGRDSVKILDLGLARFDDVNASAEQRAAAELTQDGDVMGTIDYMAPEQVVNTRNADAKSDVYSLGCTLFRLLTGKQLFTGQTLMECIMAHREQPAPAASMHRPEVPPAVDQLIQRMVAKRPDDRPTMQDVVTAIDQLKRGMPVVLPPAAGAAPLPVAAPQPTMTAQPVAIPQATSIPQATTIPAAASHPTAPSIPLTKSSAGKPPKRGSNLKWIAAAGFLLVAFGVVVVIRDKDGNKVAEVNVPEGGSVAVNETKPADPSQASTPSVAPLPAVPTRKADENFALDLSGSASYGRVLLSAPVKLKPPYTVEAWIRYRDQRAIEPILDLVGHTRILGSSNASTGHRGFSFNFPVHSYSLAQPNRTQVSAVDWMHVALAADEQGTLYSYAHGNVVNADATKRGVANGNAAVVETDLQAILIGAQSGGNDNRDFHNPFNSFGGWIDEVRVSTTLRYPTSFEPQRRCQPDEHTLALYHFDEGSGEKFLDSSGNNHHGELVNSKWIAVDSLPLAGTTISGMSTATMPAAVPAATATPTATPPVSATGKSAESALQFDGQGAHAIAPLAAKAWSPPYTVEAWVQTESGMPSELLMVRGMVSVGLEGVQAADGTQGVGFVSNFASAAQILRTNTLNPNRQTVWNHLALVVNAENGLRVFHNGQLKAYQPQAKLTVPTGEALLTLGTHGATVEEIEATRASRRSFKGAIDELRISNVARYETNFEPKRRWEPDPLTLALYHFDEGSGDEFRDASGFNRHGKVFSAQWIATTASPPAAPPVVVAVNPAPNSPVPSQPMPVVSAPVNAVAAPTTVPGFAPIPQITPPATPRPGLLVLEFPRTRSQDTLRHFMPELSELQLPVGRVTMINDVKNWKLTETRNALAMGWLKIDQPGEYGFAIDSFFNSSALLLDGKVVCPPALKTATHRVTLNAGLTPIVLFGSCFCRGEVKVTWQPPGQAALSPIPLDRLLHDPGEIALRTRQIDAATKLIRDSAAKPVAVNTFGYQPGLLGKKYARFASQPTGNRSVGDVDPREFQAPIGADSVVTSLSPWQPDPQFNNVASGFLKVDRPGEYAFYSYGFFDRDLLTINGQPLQKFRSGEHNVARITLPAGLIPIEVVAYVECNSDLIKWQPPGELELTGIPPDRLFHRRGGGAVPPVAATPNMPTAPAASPMPNVPVPAQPIETNYATERKAAEWVFAVGGSVGVEANGVAFNELKNVAGLPAGNFVVKQISLYQRPNVRDVDLINLRGLSRLNDLNLLGTATTDQGLAHLANLTTLEKLDLQHTQVTGSGVQHLRRLTSLTTLRLNSCPITDAGISTFPAFPSLTDFEMYRTGFSRLDCIRGMPKLQYINIGDTPVRDLSPLADKGEMRKLNLWKTGVTDASLIHLKSLTKLKELQLNETAVTDAGLPQLESLPELVKLDLNKTPTTSAGVQQLKQKRPGCEITWSPGTPAPIPVAAAPLVDPSLVCARLEAKRPPQQPAAEAIVFDAPRGDGRSGANGIVVMAPRNWNQAGTVWRFNYTFAGSAQGVHIIHPLGNGHVRVALLKDRVEVFSEGAYPQNVYEAKSPLALTIDRAASTTFPLQDNTTYAIDSVLEGTGRFRLRIDQVLMCSAAITQTTPLRLTPPFEDPRAPAILVAGQAGVIIGPRDRGLNHAEDIHLYVLGQQPSPKPGTTTTPTPAPITVKVQPTPGGFFGEASPNTPLGGAADMRDPNRPRVDPPAADKLAEATKTIRELFKAEFAKKKLEDQRILLTLLLGQGGATKDDLVGRFALLLEARNLAAELADVAGMTNAVASASDLHRIDEAEWLAEGVDLALKKPITTANAKALTKYLDERVTLALGADNFAGGKRLLDLAIAASRKAQDAALTKSLVERGKAFEAQKKAIDAIEKARETLATSPADPAANLTMGKHYCFVTGEWPLGLAALAKCDDATIVELAKASLADPQTPAEQVALADLWWSKSDKKAALTKLELQFAAAHWYQLAQGQSDGLLKAKVEKRLTEAQEAIKAISRDARPDRAAAGPTASTPATTTPVTVAKPAAPTKSTTPAPALGTPRQIAEFYLKLGGTVRIKTDPQTPPVNIPNIGALPAGSFMVIDLRLTNLSTVNDNTVAGIRGLPDLTHLYLNGSAITDEALAHATVLPKLEVVNLSGSPQLTDKVLFYLAQIKTLQHLVLNSASVSDRGLTQLKTLADLENLSLVGTQVTGSFLSELKGLEKLTQVNLANTPVDDRALGLIKLLPKLQFIDLSKTRITDAGLSQLKDHPALKGVYCGDTALTDAGLKWLQNIKTLETVRAQGTRVTSAGVMALNQMLPKCRVDR